MVQKIKTDVDRLHLVLIIFTNGRSVKTFQQSNDLIGRGSNFRLNSELHIHMSANNTRFEAFETELLSSIFLD